MHVAIPSPRLSYLVVYLTLVVFCNVGFLSWMLYFLNVLCLRNTEQFNVFACVLPFHRFGKCSFREVNLNFFNFEARFYMKEYL